MPNFHETSPHEHTPDAALASALLWLRRTPRGLADVVLCTLPGRLHKGQEIDLYSECYRVLGENGSLFVWGNSDGLDGLGFEQQLVCGDLTHAWTSWYRPMLNEEVRLPEFNTRSREMPPSVVEYALRATGPASGRLALDVFPRAPHLAQTIGREIGCKVLSVAPVSDLYTASDTAAPAWVRDRWFADDFWKYLKKQGNCLIYPSAQHASGYARLRIGGTEYYAHHVAWMLSHRRVIPQGVPILHASCPDRRCCAPQHLRLGSTAVNLDERWLGKRKQCA